MASLSLFLEFYVYFEFQFLVYTYVYFMILCIALSTFFTAFMYSFCFVIYSLCHLFALWD